jgi:DNA-binding transcriptional regulator LsrR (DeoR family)
MHSDLLPCAVAKLLSEQPELSQDEVAGILHTSQSQVSRIVKDLKATGQLCSRWHVASELLASPDWQRMEVELLGSSDVGQLIARHAKFPDSFQLRVVGDMQDESDATPDEFGKAAAAVIGELIAPVRRLGVGCGKTIEAVVRGISAPGRGNAQPRKRIVPILAEPAHLRNIDQSPSYSSTLMAESLQKTLYGEIQLGVPVLRGVPAYLPRRYLSDEVLQMVQEVPGFRSIFLGDPKKNERPEIDLLDCILTGAGAVSPDDEERQGTLIRERLEQENYGCRKGRERIDVADLDRMIYGDLAGLLIPREEISPEDAKVVHELNKGLVGLEDRHLKEVCKRAAKPSKTAKRPPGVILAAFGPQKVNLIAAGIHAGLVTTLVTTKRCVQQLAEVIAAAEK